MPHTNRKKKATDRKAQADSQKKFAYSKREYITSEDGWTHVADKSWKSMMSKEKSHAAVESPLADMTLEEMVKEHDRYSQQWESSDACAKLKIILSSTENEGRCVVENAICLGLGSLQALSMEWRRSSHTQLAALTTIRDTLSKLTVTNRSPETQDTTDEALDLTGQMIVQDPRFTDLDKSLLESMGCKVVDHPEAFRHLNKNSLVYAIHCAFQLLWKVKERVDPALLIANHIRDSSFEQIRYKPEVPDEPEDEFENSQKNEEEKEKTYLERYEKTCSLIQNCEEIAFPKLRNDFSDTVIYWRRSQRPTNSQDTLVIESS